MKIGKLRAMKLSYWKDASAIFLFFAATAISLSAQTFTKLQDFNGPNGAQPGYMSLIQGIDGNMYGTTDGGGTYSQGSIFELTTAGGLVALHDFCATLDPDGYCADGTTPYGGLVQAANGTFYGTTSLGGDGGTYGDSGTIFQLTLGSTSVLTTLYNFQFTNGAFPYAGLVQGSGNTFYGTAYEGGTGHSGTIFSITTGGSYSLLYNFCLQSSCPDGAYPISGLVETANGTLYGTTSFTIFDFNPGTGKLNTLYSFCTGTACDIFQGPYGTLIQGSDGNFYGTTSGGGEKSSGMIFKITPGGVFTSLYSFCSDFPTCPDGSTPTGTLVQGNDGNFYGTTQNGGAHSDNGTIFELKPTTTPPTLTTLYSFCLQPDCADGSKPYGGLIQDTNGTFYGTTFAGGADGEGTIFSLSVGLGPFVETKPSFGKEGAVIGILGQGFSSSSVVEFGGVKATSSVNSSTFLEATVPSGALTGSVTVTTSGTTLQSNQKFLVLPEVLSFSPTSGPVGTPVTITGSGFLQGLGVGFGDEVPATNFTIVSDTEVTADVPSGAKTGPVGIETKGGIGVSSKIFTVN